MLTFVVAVVTAETDVAPDSSSLAELLLAPEMLSMADVAAVNGCSKNLFYSHRHATNHMKRIAKTREEKKRKENIILEYRTEQWMRLMKKF